MLKADAETLHHGRILKVCLRRDTDPLPYAEVIHLWQKDKGFRSLFLSLLADAPYDTFRWETPPVTLTTVQRPFEFVLLDSPGLAAYPDPTPFADLLHSTTMEEGVTAFPNLGHDAQLVVPGQQGPRSAYGHLAAFTRAAPQPQNHALWKIVGREMERMLGPRPIWLSTAGGGCFLAAHTARLLAQVLQLWTVPGCGLSQPAFHD